MAIHFVKREVRLLNKFVLSIATILILGGSFPQMSTAAGPSNRAMLVHHSTGQNIILEGDLRGFVMDLNAQNGTDVEFWDHDNNNYGITNGAGQRLYRNYDIPDDDTSPAGFHQLWTTNNSARDSLLANFDTIAFKPCYYPTCYITSDAQLDQYKVWYLEMRDFFDQHPDKTFIVLSPPALHRYSNNLVMAARARLFSVWLGSDEFLEGHPNVKYFNYFNMIADDDANSEMFNMLAYEYERGHDGMDWHPNEIASLLTAPPLADFIYETVAAAQPTAVPGVGSMLQLNQNHPNPFNPSTRIEFSLDQSQSLSIDVFDVQGHLVRHLVNSTFAEGNHHVVWDGMGDNGRMASSGVYFARVTPENGSPVSRKMVLAK